MANMPRAQEMALNARNRARVRQIIAKHGKAGRDALGPPSLRFRLFMETHPKAFSTGSAKRAREED